MVQATTPTFILTLPESVDLSEAQNIYFTLKQDKKEIVKTDLSIDGQNISVYLTQEETLPFTQGYAFLQLNWTYADGSRACSKIVRVAVGNNLLKKVVE